MNFKIALSKGAAKALKKGVISRDKLTDLLEEFVLKMDGSDVQVDVIKLKGYWKGHYRIRTGNLRIIVKPDFLNKVIEVKRVGPRGDVYK
ncbi:MAG: hypothetical protein J7L43_00200 [Candidatus Aenigmarchaeota archaeon]|nr:hypothetical protein [Candidatus Aenigmarchaeota archaeon]